MAGNYLDVKIDKINNKKVRDIMKTTEKSRKYPKDALTDGALQIIVEYIIELEKTCGDTKKIV